MTPVDAARCEQCNGTGNVTVHSLGDESVPCPAVHTVLLVDGARVHCTPDKLERWCDTHNEPTAADPSKCRWGHSGSMAGPCRIVPAIVTTYDEATP